MSERLKLKRGLSDISPLFSKSSPRIGSHLAIRAPEQPSGMPGFQRYPEVIFSWSADDENDAHFLNHYFASKLVSSDAPGLVLSVGELKKNGGKVESWNQSLKRLSAAPSQLDQVFSSGTVSGHSENFFAARVFLEMKMSLLLKRPELIKTIDRVVLFMHPQVESITESYRKLKKLSSLGLTADVSAVFDADDAGGLPARVYELFSDFVSKRLSLSTNYLGTLHLSRGGSGLSQDLRWSSWQEDSRMRHPSIEKLRFLSWLESNEGADLCR